ncbi:MAG: F-box protein [Candidatus Paceibacterota bacterium]
MNNTKKLLSIWLREKNILYEYIIDKICGYLDEKSVVKLSSTCKKYRDIITIKMNMYWYRYYCNRYNTGLLKSIKHIREIECSCFDNYQKKISNYNDRRKLELFLTKRVATKKYGEGIVTKLCTKMNNNNNYLKISADFIFDSAAVLCKNRKHIIFEYDLEKYNSQCDYFGRCINGKKEKKARETTRKQTESTNKMIRDTNTSLISARQDIDIILERIERLQLKQVELEKKKEIYDSKATILDQNIPKIGEERKTRITFAEFY